MENNDVRELKWFQVIFFIIGIFSLSSWIITFISFLGEKAETKTPFKFWEYRRKVIFVWSGMFISFLILLALMSAIFL